MFLFRSETMLPLICSKYALICNVCVIYSETGPLEMIVGYRILWMSVLVTR